MQQTPLPFPPSNENTPNHQEQKTRIVVSPKAGKYPEHVLAPNNDVILNQWLIFGILLLCCHPSCHERLGSTVPRHFQLL